MLNRARWMVICLAIQSPVWAAENPRHVDLGPGLADVKTLEQNWTDETSNWFYNLPQGSRLLPYDWFVHLEQAGSQERFLDAKHIRALGYIPRTPDPQNSDGLPIGFVQDVPYEDGTPGLGVMCAACHTRQINHNGTAYLIDGAPTTGDFERLLKELVAALRVTANEDAKFTRFSAAVLPEGTADDVNATLRATVRSVANQRGEYNERNLPRLEKDQFGPGRVDAFGAMSNPKPR